MHLYTYPANPDCYNNFKTVYKFIMAIPFYTQVEEEDEESVIEIGESETELFNDSESEEEQLEREESFVGKLLKELVGVYARCSNNSGRRRIGGGESRRRNISRTINDQSVEALPEAPPTLPDLISDHVQAQGATPTEFRPLGNNGVRPSNRQMITQPPKKLQETALHDLNSELVLDLKMTIDFSYQRIGRDLRQIGDQFESANSTNSSPRRRHPAGNHHHRQKDIEIGLKFELAFSLLIPATLLSLSLALFKCRYS